MNKKQILIEIFWAVLAYIACCFIAGLIMSSSPSSYYVSDIYVGYREDDLQTSFSDYLNPLLFGFAFYLFPPVLFLTNTVREAFHKFNRQPNNILLMIVTIISIVLTAIVTFMYREFASFVFGSWTIYPPLSALSDLNEAPSWVTSGIYAFYVLDVLQVIILLLLIRKIFVRPNQV